MNKNYKQAFNDLGMARDVSVRGIANAKKSYDVKITLNKTGKKEKKMAVRFGFLNNAYSFFEGFKYLQISSVEKAEKNKSERIYFFPSEEKEAGSNKICKHPKSSTSRFYTFTPTEPEEKIFRAKWVNYTFQLKFDEKHGGLPFIERDQEI